MWQCLRDSFIYLFSLMIIYHIFKTTEANSELLRNTELHGFQLNVLANATLLHAVRRNL